MCNLFRRNLPIEEEQDGELERERAQARAEAREQREQNQMSAAYEILLAQDLSEPRSLVGFLVCYPEHTRFNINRRLEVGRYLRGVFQDRVHAHIPRAEPSRHRHECRVMAVILKDDGRYPRTSYQFIDHLNHRALEAVNSRLVPCHPSHRIQYPFVTNGLMLAWVRLSRQGRRPSGAVCFHPS